jgi:alkylation response protein AidB-like acyl-CoA dehydrogenase
MSNFFTDNKDLQFALDNLDFEEMVALKENNYKFSEEFDRAPVDLEDAVDNYRRVLTEIGDVTGERIEPRSRTVDEEGPHFEDGVVTYHPLTQANLKDLRDAGVMGVMLPHDVGGLNFPNTIYTMMTEMVSRADGSLQNLFGLQDISETIAEFGTEEQKAQYLPKFATGEYDGSMDLTEPDSGSDLQSVRLKATQDPKTGQWYLNGNKRFITNGCAKVHLVLARSEEGTSDGRGLSMFICESCPELVVRRIEHKLGIHGVATAELQYNNVPAQLCGLRRRGLTKYVMSLMNGARVAISAQALGIAEAAYREARKYASEREQFKKTIDKFPPIYDMLTRMKLKTVAARTLLYETTKIVDLRQGYNHIMDHTPAADLSPEVRANQKLYTKLAAVLTPMSKAYCTEIANEVAYDGIQIHGGTGFMHDFNAERFYRDARITNIYEGTTQLQVVAAIGGVMLRTLDPVVDDLAALPFEGVLDRMAKTLEPMRKKLQEAVKFVNEKKDTEYQALMARQLVSMETYIFIGYLMLRDALKDQEREALAEKFILNAIPEIESAYHLVMSADTTTIDKHSEIIGY